MVNKNIKDSYNFLVLGDSISKGIIYNEEKEKYISLKGNYVDLLQNSLKGTINNVAKFGNTILRGIERLQRDVLKNKPDIVLIEFGGNDCDFDWQEIADNPYGEHKPKTDFAVFKIHLKELIRTLENVNITPVLMTLPPLDPDRYFKWISKNNVEIGKNILKWLGSVNKIYWWQERYNSAIISIAEETKTRLIDVRSAFLNYPDFRQFICADGIHPNEKGHEIIANKIYEYIKTNYTYLLKG